MLSINADGLDHRELNEALRSAERSCRIESCLGQRFIAAGMADKDIILQCVSFCCVICFNCSNIARSFADLFSCSSLILSILSEQVLHQKCTQ